MNTIWTYLRRWVGPLLRRFDSAVPALLLVATLLLLVGIWWLGPGLTWRDRRPLASHEARAIASLLVVLVPMILWTLRTRYRYGKLQRERRRQDAVADDPQLPLLQQQQSSMDANLGRLLDNGMGRRSLYQLPWFLLLGDQESGKSSFISGCDQRFQKLDTHQATEPATWAVDWWVSHDAVVIDPPGAFMTQHGTPEARFMSEQGRREPLNIQRRLWLHLLQWLAQNRSRRALNGLLLVVDLPLLLSDAAAQRSVQAQALRSRLYEVTRELGSRLPLYIVLGKMDLIEGFEELFARVPAARREALLGFTFSLQAVESFDAWLPELAAHYDAFLKSLGEQTKSALSGVMDAASRRRLQSFQATLAGLRPLLLEHLNEVLGCDRFTTPALVRGLYLCSMRQQGEVRSRFALAASQPYDLTDLMVDTKPQGPGRVYFAHCIFDQVIQAEAGLAGDNLKTVGHKRRLVVANSGVAALSTVLAVGGWQLYYDVNRQQADNVLEKSREFSSRDIDARLDPTGRNLLVPLDQIRNAVAIYGDYRAAWPLVADFGLYQGRAIGPKVDAAYLSLLSRRFLPALATGVLASINDAAPGSNQQLAALRVYRMLEDRQNRRPQMVQEWMAGQWQAAYPGQAQVQSDLRRHLAYALQYADTDLPQYRQRITQVQQLLREIPLQQRVYMTLKQQAQDRLHGSLDLRQEIGPAFDVIYRPVSGISSTDDASRLLVPSLLTAKGYNEYFTTHSPDIADLALIDQWVLGERERIEYSDEDRQALASRIRALYSADYVNSWRQLLNRFAVTDFEDLKHAVSVLEHTTGPAAPLRRLLETVRDNTVVLPALVPGQALAAATAVDAGAADEVSQQGALAIRRAFAGMSQLLIASGDKPSYYDETMAAITAVHEYAKAVNDSPEHGKAALNAVLRRFALTGDDPISILQRIATGLPEPIGQHVKKLADQTAQVLVVEALRELEKRWETDVYSFYRQRLAGRYPFVANGADASLEDFEAFFGPQGRLRQFQDRYLKVFLEDNLDALYSQSQGSYLVRPDVMEQLDAAERIRETFFNNRGNLSVQFTVEPLGLSATQRTSVLGLDGQLVPYSHGPSAAIGLIWPNTLGEQVESKVTLVNRGGNSSSVGFRGPWSMYRLLSKGQLNGRSGTSVDLSFRAGDGMMRYRFSAEKALNPFTQASFSGFALPRTLLQRPAAAQTPGAPGTASQLL